MPEKQTRRRYSLEFKRRLVAEAEAGRETQAQIGARYGLPKGLLSHWVHGNGMERSDVGTVDPVAVDTPPPPRPRGRPRKTTTVALAVAATQRALEKTNGHAPAGATGAGTLIREVLQRLRTVGVHIEQITVTGDNCEISYTVKEAIDL